VIFGTLQHCFVLNTSVNSILNKFITPVAPPSLKINNSVFHLQNQAIPLHSNAHIFKIPTPMCTIFGIIEHRDIVMQQGNCSVSETNKGIHVWR